MSCYINHRLLSCLIKHWLSCAINHKTFFLSWFFMRCTSRETEISSTSTVDEKQRWKRKLNWWIDYAIDLQSFSESVHLQQVNLSTNQKEFLKQILRSGTGTQNRRTPINHFIIFGKTILLNLWWCQVIFTEEKYLESMRISNDVRWVHLLGFWEGCPCTIIFYFDDF